MDKTNTTSRSERRDAAENRQRILDVASKLFELHGVERVSMNQIASEAQIGAGTLYRRYRNKSELCMDLIKDNATLFFEEVEIYLQENAQHPPSERLRGLLTLFIQFREKMRSCSQVSRMRYIKDQSPEPQVLFMSNCINSYSDYSKRWQQGMANRRPSACSKRTCS